MTRHFGCHYCVSWSEKLDEALTALRRIRSLEEKNVPKYAQQMAKDALKLIEKE